MTLWWAVLFLGVSAQEETARCDLLFSCETDRGKFIRICGVQDESDVDQWRQIRYRYGPQEGKPELESKAPLYFWHEKRGNDYRVTVRFTNGG